VLHALGMLAAVQDKEQFVAAQLALAAPRTPGRLTFEEFSSYYASLQFAGAHGNTFNRLV
jgi:hypothetical protein